MQSLVAEQVLPSPSSWGWVKSESGWVPFWTPLPRAAKALEELVSCGCTKICSYRQVLMLQEGACLHSQMQMSMEEIVMGDQVLLQHQLPTNAAVNLVDMILLLYCMIYIN